jgi:hypothetical protein
MIIENAAIAAPQTMIISIGSTIISIKVILITFCVLHELHIPAGRWDAPKSPAEAGLSV